MNQTQSTPKLHVLRTFAMLAAVSVALAPLALAADQSIETTVAALNTLSIDAGGTVELAPTVALAATDSSTDLIFGTNDGSTYRITVEAAISGWAFAPFVDESAANTYPVLRFVSADSDAGTQSTTPGVLIDSANAVQAAVDVVTAITNESGTATVTLDASITQTVVAGFYTTTLTYALVTP